MEEVNQLQQIFPTWDQKSLLALLKANGMSMDRTVEAIFIIEAAKESGQLDEIMEPEEDIPEERPRQTRTAAPRSENEFYRGLRCKLPDNFLRPPGWEAKVVGDRDAQLALMLQNELYSQEMIALGRARGPGGRGPGVGPTPTNSRPRGGSGSNQDLDVIPDLGIMKTLTTVGGMASRFVTRLSAPTSGTPSRDGGSGDDYAIESNAETNPLVRNREEDEEDEVISFDETNRRNRHVLESETFQRRSSRGGDGKKDT